MNAPTLTPKHVIPFDNPGEHQASERCRCGPLVSYRDLATGAPVYRHRTPPVVKRERTTPWSW